MFQHKEECLPSLTKLRFERPDHPFPCLAPRRSSGIRPIKTNLLYG